jgi:hypothetical protein
LATNAPGMTSGTPVQPTKTTPLSRKMYKGMSRRITLTAHTKEVRLEILSPESHNNYRTRCLMHQHPSKSHSKHPKTMLCIVLIRRSGGSERTLASTNGLRPRCIAGPKYLRKSEDRSKVGNDLVKVGGAEVGGAEVGGWRTQGRRFGMSESRRRLRQEET